MNESDFTRGQRVHRRFERAGNLAIDPRAMLTLFLEPPTRENQRIGTVAIVDVSGPLTHHAGDWCDSYDEIADRVAAACSSDATSIVLRIDSPGGDASGCVELARTLRQRCAAAGKPLIAYVDGHALSAGYALASSASRVVLSDSALVGSIGVINTRPDQSAMNAQIGLRYLITTSGARKADGHTDNPITDAERVETQAIVDSLASVFFDLVAEMRPRLKSDAVKALEAGIFHGASAIDAKLADTIMSFDALIADLEARDAAEEADWAKIKTGLAILAKGKGPDATMAAQMLKAIAPPVRAVAPAAAAPKPTPRLALVAPVVAPAPAAAAPAPTPEPRKPYRRRVWSFTGVLDPID